jgi:peptidyl-prolyl cis-trans isomerase C
MTIQPHHDSARPALALLTGLALLTQACSAQEKNASAQPPAGDAGPAAAAPAAAEVSGADTQVVVTVEGETMTRAQLKEQAMNLLMAQGQRVPKEMLDQAIEAMGPRVIERFVGHTLLFQEAERQDLEIGEHEIVEQMSRIQGQLPPGTSLDDALAQMGMTEEKLRNQMQEDMLVRKMMQHHTESLPELTDEDIKAFYEKSPDRFGTPERVKARHILIRVDPNTDQATKDAKREEVEAVRKELMEEDADFAEIAKAKSEGPSAARGGDLGEFGRGQMVPTFEEAAFSQEIGAIGEIVETQFGYHIIKVEDRQSGETKPFEEVKEQVAMLLERERESDAIQNLVDGLKAQASIDYAPEFKPVN